MTDNTVVEASENTTETTTLRATARQTVMDSVSACAGKRHEEAYQTLYVYRNGVVDWDWHYDQNEQRIDKWAKTLDTIPAVATVGTGSFRCNCDYCESVYSKEDEEHALECGKEYNKSEKYADYDGAISDCVSNDDLGNE